MAAVGVPGHAEGRPEPRLTAPAAGHARRMPVNSTNPFGTPVRSAL